MKRSRTMKSEKDRLKTNRKGKDINIFIEFDMQESPITMLEHFQWKSEKMSAREQKVSSRELKRKWKLKK